MAEPLAGREREPLVVFEWPLVAWESELMSHPELLVPPEALVPYVAWPGRLTLLAGPDKIGKSTLLRQAAIAVATRGQFLGQQLNGRTPGKVLWFGLEESLADMVRPLVAMGYRPTRPSIGFCRRLASVDEFYRALEFAPEWALIVVDTLAAFGYALGMESERDETEMTRVLHMLLDVARGGPAVVLNHHVTKSIDNPRERGSGAIAATCDVILTMGSRAEDETVVDVKARGRLPVKSFTLEKSGGIFRLGQPAVAAAHDARSARVLQLVTAEAGELTSNAVARRLGGDRNSNLRAVNRLVELGILVRERGHLRPAGMGDMGGMHTRNTTQSGGGMGGMFSKENTYHTHTDQPLPTSGGAIPPDDAGEAWEPDSAVDESL
jgi:hypothetical protein